jgi:ferric-dicitrate binding protein FerR (iron transport regulator)
MKWEPGFSPKDHVTMLQEKETREWQEARMREDREWREKQDAKLQAFQRETEERTRVLQLEEGRRSRRWAFWGALLGVLATIAGALLPALLNKLATQP